MVWCVWCVGVGGRGGNYNYGRGDKNTSVNFKGLNCKF